MAEVAILVKAKDEASQVMEGLSGRIDGMSKQLKIAGAVMVGTGAAITGMLGMAAKAAAEEEAGIVRLSTAMKNMGLSYEDTKDSLEKWIDTQQQKTSIADDAQRSSLASLVRMTGDMTKAQNLLTLAMDIAVGTGKDLESANTLVMYAMGGNWGMLERYIPALKQAKTEEEKWAKLREMFAGQAEAYGQTMSGQMQLLENNIGDVKEAIGDIITKAIAPLAGHISRILPEIKAWIAEHPQLVKGITLAAGAIGLILIPLGTFLIMLPMLASGIALVTAASSPWLLIIGAVVVGLVALVAAGVLVYKNWDKICEWAKKVSDWFVNIYETVKEKVLVAFDWVKNHLELVLIPFAPLLAAGIAIYKNWDKICEVAARFKEKLLDLIEPLKNVWDKVSGLIGKSPGLIMLTDCFDAAGDRALQFGDKLSSITSSINAVTSSVNRATSAVGGFALPPGMTLPETGGGAGWFKPGAATVEAQGLLNQILGMSSTDIAASAGSNPFGPRGMFAGLFTEEGLKAASKWWITMAVGGSAGWQRGGIIPGPIGRAYPAIVHGGEPILPAGAQIVLPAITLDGEVVAERMAFRIADLLRGQGYI